ncbi:CRAL/TRIO domain-containing protein [Rhizophagus irregularis]|uniref:CRAL/TRIO domain-containing protein n=1 Tax=Rhizophagus irregularis TaxID=588596 RepID=A0A2N0QDI6_9GLOM|nr:CRAL/TRIO domain-containing protein [Rhizophagus irregularis]
MTNNKETDIKSLYTKIPILTCPDNVTLPVPPELTAEQEEKFSKVREYVDSILLPKEDDRYQEEKNWASDACLKRNLRAAKWNLTDAKNRIKYSLEWRREYKPSDIDPKTVEAEAVTGKQHLNGFDNNGRPIFYLRPGLENTLPGPDQLRFVIFNFESAITTMPENVENIVIIIDFNKCTARSSPGLGVAKEFMHALSSHYPERLGYSLIINAPWYFWGFFKLLSPFIDPVTKNKIKFVDIHNPGKTVQNAQWVNCLDFINENQLESEYGGSNAFEYHHETYWKTLCERIGKSPN